MFATRLWTAIACVAWATAPALADEDYAPVCELKGTNGMVTMLLCPEGLQPETLAQEGKAACDGRKPCGAWVWTDASAIPEEAPDAHDKLPKASVQQALAIWMNEAEQLISLAKETSE
ncbi:hypothetical protein [Roseovarius aestuariivivens]|uniref:hypothetical protein n=1 Tax=Roseovarius aestuariivivens TaxID=1888910 RepID=UPI001080B057|nr:hypothetical protein [Roseovarius aestuariivivens]